jgi:glutamine---fructose-6-phosphate transaminase (isomerizing)
MGTRGPRIHPVSDTLLLEELSQQPQVVERLITAQREAISSAGAIARAAGVRSVLIAARGTSDNAARYAQHVFGRFLRLPVALATPSLSTLYGAGPRLERTLVLGISQSGESPDVCAVIEDAREQGQPTVALTNAPNSPLARAAESTIDIGAGAERSVAATKTYTASLAAIAALTVELCDDRALRADLESIAASMQTQLECGIGSAAELLTGVDRCALIGRGPNYSTAFEAALKIKELTGVAAEPYSPADLMHGPVAVLGLTSPLIAIAAEGPALSSVSDAVRAGREREAHCLAITDAPEAFPSDSEILALTRVPEWLSPLVAILPAQMLAAQVALERGISVDTPFGLSKVTRTL